MVVKERRQAVLELVHELGRLIGSMKRMEDEVRGEIARAISEAIGVKPPEEEMLLNLYRFRQPSGEDINTLRRLVARYMGLEEGADIVEYLRSLGSNSARHHGEGGQGSALDDTEPGRREENGGMHNSRG